MTFTIQHNRVIDQKIAADLRVITATVRQEIGSLLDSIVLVGGFGRAEGSVICTPDRITVLGDYDIFLCLRTCSKFKYAWQYRQQQESMYRLAEKLAEQLGIKQIDLVLKHRSYFGKSAKPSLEQYEVKHGHMLLYGNQDPCANMPEWTTQDVPLHEFIRLLRNRGMGLLMAALYMEGHNFADVKRENFIVEVNKAWLAMGDLFLYQLGKYHVSYRQRLSRVIDPQFEFPSPWKHITANYRQALKFKLSPDWAMFEQTDLQAWWLETKQTWLAVLQEQESIRSDIAWQSWSVYARTSSQRLPFRQIATSWLRSSSTENRNRYRRLWYISHPAFMLASISLLLQARESAGYAVEPLREMSSLWKWGNVQNVAHSWSSMAKMVLASMHPQGEVSRILNA
jgi:hypothetical protein